jgi:hypothetical protein
MALVPILIGMALLVVCAFLFTNSYMYFSNPQYYAIQQFINAIPKP